MELPVTINGIIFVVLLVIPGVILKRFYFQGEFTKQFGGGIFADRLISSIFLGLIVQMLSLLILSQHPKFSFDMLTTPVSAFFENLEKKKVVVISSEQIKYILVYIFFNLALSILLGTIAHKIVRILRLDIIFHVLRFNNQWNYYFRGDILYSWDFKPSKKGKVLTTYVDIVMDVEHQGEKKIVSGILAEYTISAKTGELDLIYLTEAKRFSHTLQPDENDPDLPPKKKGMTDVPGDCMIIPYSKVIDMNLHYHIKETNPTRRKELFNIIIGLMSLIGVLIIAIYPWWLNLSFIRTLFGILFSLFTWIFLLALVSALVAPNDNQKKLTGGALWVIVVVMLAFSFITAMILQLPVGEFICNIYHRIVSLLP
ncbi:hypothetical protein [Dyadobacter diqingensis]|uniref:hypothetical protein n=1 Tax=Dyadobacter diqingensis TaxID=2938121 RepID=UPI0020C21183|nr:hypothetical protein [Dyadobacter diqingensis]